MQTGKLASKKKLITAAAVIVLLGAAFAAVRFIPLRLLKGRQPQDITRIDVIGFTGAGLVTLDETETRLVAENLYECGAVRTKISFGRMGYVYQLSLYEGDRQIRTFSVIDDGWGRDSLFFYEPLHGSYCKTYLDQLAEKYQNKDVVS